MFCTVRFCKLLRDYDSRGHFWSQTVAAVCYLNECKIDFMHPHTVHLPSQIDGDSVFALCWRKITLIAAALSPNGACMSQTRFIGTYVHAQVAQVSLNLSVWRHICQRLERGSRVYCCIRSTSSPEVSMATEKVKVWPEISSEFRRDREKHFLLAHKDSFPQTNMTESISEWPQSSALHEQSVTNKHSAHNFSTLIHYSDTVYTDTPSC